jgi:hypothetical protein
MNAYVTKTGAVIRPVKAKGAWRYQIMCPLRGLFPPQGKPRCEAGNRDQIETVGRESFGGGRWV